jgi:hypothetical protein
MEKDTPGSADSGVRISAPGGQPAFLRRQGCLLLVSFSILAPMWAMTFFGEPSLWRFAAGIAGFFAAGMTVHLWVLPRIQRKFDRENRLRATVDPREFVVLLRSFESQVLKLKSGLAEPGNLMKEIPEAIPDDLAALCIGAGETIRGLHAPARYVRLEPSDQEWYKVFALVASGARALIITPDATPGCREELRTIAEVPALLAKTLIWMPHRHQACVKSAWEQTRDRLSGTFRLPDYEAGGVLYRPNADLSARVSWRPVKGRLREVLGEALGELPPSKYSLRVVLGELDRQGLAW